MSHSFCELPKAFPPRPRAGRGAFRAFLHVMEALCWIAGLAGIGWVALTVVRIHRVQEAQERQLQNLERAAPPSQPEVLPTPQPGEPVGKITIPRIGLSAIVAEGVDESTLRTAVGHIPGTAVPEQIGNVALAGHRDTFFRDLGRVHVNDLIVMETPRGKFQYRVERTSVVGPKDTEVLQSDGQPELTLITCFPFHFVGAAPERFVVEAVRVAPS
jgi:sortase A